jgi:hypothetical protein
MRSACDSQAQRAGLAPAPWTCGSRRVLQCDTDAPLPLEYLMLGSADPPRLHAARARWRAYTPQKHSGYGDGTRQCSCRTSTDGSTWLAACDAPGADDSDTGQPVRMRREQERHALVITRGLRPRSVRSRCARSCAFDSGGRTSAAADLNRRTRRRQSPALPRAPLMPWPAREARRHAQPSQRAVAHARYRRVARP